MEGELLKWVFYSLCILTSLSGVMVVLQSHPVRSVLFLVMTFFMSAALWLMLQAEFLSLILLLVYVGAVMTLFLFVVMMLYVDVEAMQAHLLRFLPLGGLIVGGFSGLVMLAFSHSAVFKKTDLFSQGSLLLGHGMVSAQQVSNTEQIGMVLYTTYVYPFELAAVILLIAMVAAITLTHRDKARSKKQDVTHQIMVDPATRVRLVSKPPQCSGEV